MSEVKRFGYFWDGSFDVKDDGAFIRYEDYAKLKAQCDALAAENAALKDLQPTKEMIVAAHQELEEYDNIQLDDDAVVFTWQAMRSRQKTPTTDAYLNSVRAEAVIQAADDIGDSTWEEHEASGILAAVDALCIIAAQLRAVAKQ